MTTYNYIIVGAGVAGCVLAYRLSEDQNNKVLLIESGPEDKHPLIHMPKGIGKLIDSDSHTWKFPVKQERPNDQPTTWVRGRVVGGSSSINGMMYVRGQPADYESVSQVAGEEWSWEKMKSAFLAMENHELGKNAYRGSGGPQRVTMTGISNPILLKAIAALNSQGSHYTLDINAPEDIEKCGFAPRMIYKGRRQSASVSFLDKARSRSNLTVLTDTQVDRVLFEKRKAVGVRAFCKGEEKTFFGGKIVVSSGTLSSPLILERSGVGDASVLDRIGADQVAQNSNVGKNLLEHCCLIMQWRVRDPFYSTNSEYSGAGLIKNLMRYYASHSGLMADGSNDVLAFVKTDRSLPRPNVQLLISPHSFDYSKEKIAIEKAPGFQVAAYPLRPRSAGEIHCISRSNEVPPEISYDPLLHSDDQVELLGMVKYVRNLVCDDSLVSVLECETRPGLGVVSDEQILEAIRNLSGPAYHAVGTCRMGVDADSVVDEYTRVRGVENMHVVDLSVFPTIIAGNTNAPTAAVAWRAADLLLSGA